MSEENDPFPDAPSYEEIEEMRPSMEEALSGTDESREWYNQAPFVAARLIVEAAREHPAYREAVVEADDWGVGHEMVEYDPDRYEKLNTMGLSAAQGSMAERMARDHLEGDDV